MTFQHSIPCSVRRFKLVVLLFLVGLTPFAASADIYAYIDEKGEAHFSDTPDDARYTLFMKQPKAPPAPVASEAAAEPEQDVANVTPAALPARAAQFGKEIVRAAQAHQLDPRLLHAVIETESGYNPRAVSPKGAVGLMQLMPATAKRFGVDDAFDIKQNIRAGARYLAELIKRFSDVRLALAAYNAGEGAVERHGRRIPPYAETQNYVPKVLRRYESLRRATS